MKDLSWRRFKHLPQGVFHAYIAEDETIAVCGRSTGSTGVEHICHVFVNADTDTFSKCKNCVYILEGSLAIARIKASGGGMLRS